MKNDKIVEITPDVKWIGILDPNLRHFDIVMETKSGATYNSYYINATKKTIIDTCKEKFSKEYLAKVQSVVNPKDIEYIIINHTEPDHAGSLKNLIDIAPNAVVVGSGNAMRYLYDIIGHDFKNLIVKDGQTLDLGNKTLKFIGAPNLHWPDTIYTYLEENQILFTCDSFGSHYCNENLFDDEVGNFDEAFKYYYDMIISPYSRFMLRAIEKIRPLNIKVICTGHGPILRKNWKKYVDITEQFARKTEEYNNPPEKRILIAYVSAYGYTAEIAEYISEGIKENLDAKIEICNIEMMPTDILSAKIASSKGIIVGSTTINQNLLLPIYQLFSLINPLRDKGKVGAAFGSYGWSGEAANIIEANLKLLKLRVDMPALNLKFRPNPEAITKCRQYGADYAKHFIDCLASLKVTN